MVEIFDRVNKFLVVWLTTDHRELSPSFILSCYQFDKSHFDCVHTSKTNACSTHCVRKSVITILFSIIQPIFLAFGTKSFRVLFFGFNRFPLIFWATNVYFYFKRFAIPNFGTELVYAHEYTLFDTVYRFLDKNLLFLATNFFNLKVM